MSLFPQSVSVLLGEVKCSWMQVQHQRERCGSATPLSRRQRSTARCGKLLVERAADVNAPSGFAVAPLGAAVGERNVELIKLLLDHGANPNSTIGTETVLHNATNNGCLDCIKAPVEAGADVNAVSSNGQYRTPLHIAKRRGLKEIADYPLADGVILPKPTSISPNLGSRRPRVKPFCG